jgi:hypothetical protein
MVDSTSIAGEARRAICNDVCRRAGSTCAEADSAASYRGDPLAPSSVPCYHRDVLLDGGSDVDASEEAGTSVDAGAGDDAGAPRIVDDVTVDGEAMALAAWKNLRAIAAVTSSSTASTAGPECQLLCKEDADYSSNKPTCTLATTGTLLIRCSFPGGPVVRDCGGAGRAPTGLEPLPTHASVDALGRYWLELQYLEAASVPAFRELAAELTQHGAPRDLVARARRAAAEEVQHAALAARELLKRGLTAAALQRRRVDGARPLVELARENAREGCVSESFGALLAGHQATAASTPELRTTFARIAREEADHAQLAWDIQTWAMGQMVPEDRAAVRAVLERAVDDLEAAEARRSRLDAEGLAEVGLDDAATRLALARQFAHALREGLAAAGA